MKSDDFFLDPFDNLTNVFVIERVLFAASLRIVLDTAAPNERVLEVSEELFMQPETKVRDGRSASLKDDGRRIVRNLPPGFRVDSDQIEIVPDFFDEAVEVPAEMSGDGNVMWTAGEKLELLHGDLVHFVKDVETGHVNSVALQNVNDVVRGGLALDVERGVADFIFVTDALDGFLVDFLQSYGRGDGDAALLLLHEGDVGRLPVQADPETLQLPLYDFLVSEGSRGVEHDEDEPARSSDSDDLPASSLALLSALNDSRQVEHLDFCALVREHAGHAGESCELVSTNFGVVVGDFVQSAQKIQRRDLGAC